MIFCNYLFLFYYYFLKIFSHITLKTTIQYLALVENQLYNQRKCIYNIYLSTFRSKNSEILTKHDRQKPNDKYGCLGSACSRLEFEGEADGVPAIHGDECKSEHGDGNGNGLHKT